MATPEVKVFEDRLRRMARRQGLVLQKSRIQDERALGYDGWIISDPRTDKTIGGDRPHPFSMSSKDVELYLTTGKLAKHGT